MKKVLFTYMFLLALPHAVSAATTFSLSPKNVSVEKGSVVTLSVYIDPQGTANFTEKINLSFPKNLLKVTAFSFASAWMALEQPGYSAIDNSLGTLTKTAGFPGGFSGKQKFGTITFIAKEAGAGNITYTGEQLALDSQNANVYESSSGATVVVADTKKAPPETKVQEKIPIEVFLDANLNSRQYFKEDKPLLSLKLAYDDARELPVKLRLELADARGETLYKEEENLLTNNDFTYEKLLDIPSLDEGEYHIRITMSGDDIATQSREVLFTRVPEAPVPETVSTQGEEESTRKATTKPSGAFTTEAVISIGLLLLLLIGAAFIGRKKFNKK